MAKCAALGRGATATDFDRADMDALCVALEESNPRATLDGRWVLAYSSEPGLYRSSPFFWGFKKLLTNVDSPITLRNAKDSSYASNVYAVTDSIPFYEIGSCCQTIGNGQFVSEVQVKIKLFDAVIPQQQSTMTTTARTSPIDDGLVLTLETTKVVDSSIAQAIPFVGNFLNDLAFPTESAFAQLAENEILKTLTGGSSFLPDAASVSLRAPYVSDTLRITRTDDGMLFVHVKDSDSDSSSMASQFAW